MKITYLILSGALLFFAGCSRRESPETPHIQNGYPEISESSEHLETFEPPEYPEISEPLNHVWVMSSKWYGFMGAAIGLSSNHYYYWFYSDVVRPDEPTYPIVGNYTLVNGVLTLEGSEHDLYSRTWMITTNAEEECLWATRDVGDLSRLMIPDPGFDAKDPFKIQRQSKAEQAVAPYAAPRRVASDP